MLCTLAEGSTLAACTSGTAASLGSLDTGLPGPAFYNLGLQCVAGPPPRADGSLGG